MTRRKLKRYSAKLPIDRAQIVSTVYNLGGIYMCKNALLGLAASISLGALSSSPAIAQNLVTNGDFETGNTQGWNNQGWSVYRIGLPNSSLVAYGSASLSGHNLLTQLLPTISGQTYSLSFDYAGGQGYDPASLSFSIGNLSSFVNSFSSGAKNFAGTFAASGNETLTFDSRNMGQSVFFDNVTVVPLSGLTAYDIFNGGIQTAIDGSYMTATVTPNFGLTLGQAANLLGLKEFNFQQVLTQIDTPFLLERADGTLAGPGFYDPGSVGLFYSPGNYGYLPGDENSFYFDPNGDAQNLTGQAGVDFNLAGHYSNDSTVFKFSDSPSNPCYSAFTYLPYISRCGLLPTAGYTYFHTTLVGVNFDGSPTAPLFEFDWRSNFAAFGTGGLGGPVFTNNPEGNDGPTAYQGTGGVELLRQRFLAGVPEPSTWATLIFGFGAMAGAIRRRHKVSFAIA